MGKKGEPRTTHGMSHTTEFRVWWSMLRRCEAPKQKGFADYGGRGISVCDRWHSFAAFLEDMGPRPSGDHSIDRVDVDGNYQPSNCRWATSHEQCRNTRRSVHITIDGQTKVLEDWCRDYRVSPVTVRRRMVKHGLRAEEALTDPPWNLSKLAASGARGVYRHAGRAKPWQAKIALPAGKYKSLGYFATVGEASSAYQAAAGGRA